MYVLCTTFLSVNNYNYNVHMRDIRCAMIITYLSSSVIILKRTIKIFKYSNRGYYTKSRVDVHIVISLYFLIISKRLNREI